MLICKGRVGKYKVISYVLIIIFYQQHSKNENYLGRFINFFEEQMGMDLHVEQMLTELIRDNS